MSMSTTALPHISSLPFAAWKQRRLPLQQPIPQQHQQRLSFYSTATVNVAPSSYFDPLKFPLSAALLKEKQDPSSLNDDDTYESNASAFLSPQEIELKECLQEYQRHNNNYHNDVDPDLLDRLHQAYMALEYWEEALQVEEMKCQEWIMKGRHDNQTDDQNNNNNYHDDEYADSIHALEYFQTTGNPIQEGHVWISLAGWYYFSHLERLQQQKDPQLELLQTALEYLQRAEGLLDTNPTLLVKCLDNQGLILRIQGDFESALDKYQQALLVVVDDNIRRALQLHVADMMTALGQSHQALNLYQELLKECQQESSQRLPQANTTNSTAGIQGVLWHNIANLHVQLGEYEMAEQEFRQSLQCKQESLGVRDDTHPELAKTWNALGALYYGVLGETRQALECFRHVLWIARAHSEYKDHSKDPQVQAALQTISDLEEQIAKEERK